MSGYTNTGGVPLALAVWLATDSYDYEDDTVSATALIKPLRQIVLGKRVPPVQARSDIGDLVSSRMGTAIHDSIERAWKTNHAQALRDLGYPNGLIQRVKINPLAADLTERDIPIYLEQRVYREYMGIKISGKPDFIGEGRVEDYKSTSVFTWINNSNDTKHRLQGSIYRWLDPQKITKDEMAIHYIFTDWQAMKARTDPKYPQQRVVQRLLPLLSLQETERFIHTKLNQVMHYNDKPEREIPPCTDEDLWRRDPVFKYYKNPEKRSRSTKNFDTRHDAQLRLIEDGNVGVVVEAPGSVTACKYCPAFSVCTQKDQLILAGDLIL